MDKTIIKPFHQIEYKIYGYTLPEVPNHKGYVKIGDTTRTAVERIFEQVGTAGLNPHILFEKLAKKSDGKWFRDKELHKYLILNGIEKKNFNNRADEWFYFNENLANAEKLTDKFINRDYDEIQLNDTHAEYILRDEQRKAVEKTLDFISKNKDGKEFLWNAKPRFGKTLTTYDLIRKIKPMNVLIVTNRPAIANSWFDDFHKFISWQEPHMKFVSETDALNGKAMSRNEYKEYINTTSYDSPSQITFISLQDLKGAKFAGGHYEKLEWIAALKWDLLVIDEAHEGIDTSKTDIAFSQISSEIVLHLSGTPFKALAQEKFNKSQIFNWSYVDEQEAKKNWDPTLGSNPYESLPTLNMFTYQMSKIIEDEIVTGLNVDEDENVDYAFDLNEFFRVKDNGKFEYEESVVSFLDNLTLGNFPFSENQYRNELNHTFWLLPRVNAAKALEKLLKSHPTFKDYKVVLAAGDGVSLSNDDLESEALNMNKNKKSFDKVREAIENNERTITLSVGQLTTGVTIPEWTAVFMLNNIESPSLYFQAAFRSQNPYEFEKNGDKYRKENAYIFDFSPDRTLRLYDEFAVGLSGDSSLTTNERKEKIKKLLNFFPVIAEDKDGQMHEIDSSEVLSIPATITSREVVKQGFMSNLLFSNISGIFSGDSPFKEILDKIPPEKNKKLDKIREIKITDPYLDDNGEVKVPKEFVLGKSKDLFGDKLYKSIEIIDEFINTKDESTKSSITELANEITSSLEDGFDNLRKNYQLNKKQSTQLESTIKKSLEDTITKERLSLTKDFKELEKKYEQDKSVAETNGDGESLESLQDKYNQERENLAQSFTKNINHDVESTIQSVVEEQMKKVENEKKKTTEDDVRDHLRGFARTIPAFLMAYGDENTELKNFEKNIDPETFLDLTSITIDEFKKLRDGFEFYDDNKQVQVVPGLFNEMVFDASILEFMETKSRLENYFDENIKKDIFDYIPPQKTNQIFTPRVVVKKMITHLESEDKDIFSRKDYKFVDLYAKSGLYMTEVVKKLNKGLEDQIPDEEERIKWILENQIYICAPSDIIYNIVKNFVFSNKENVSTKNLKQIDTMKLASDEVLNDKIHRIFGDDNLKFDVIIGNPPYQDETIGNNKTFAPPIYHKFLEESYKLADKVEMIHPGRFLYNAGSTPKSWNKKMLSDEHLKVVDYFSDSSRIFPNTDIKGGIAITYRDKTKTFGEIGTFTVYEELKSILNKVELMTDETLDSLISGRGVYKLSKIVHKDYPEIENIQSKGHKNDIGSGAFKLLKDIIFFDNKPNEESDFVSILGLENSKRTYYWMNKKYLDAPNSFYEYKVIMPQANGNGTFGEVISSPLVLEPMVGATETFLSIGGFPSELEAEAVLKYIKTKFARTMLGILKITQANTRDKWSKVPVQDFTKESDINWTQSIQKIDQQLFKKYSLDDKEISFIENNIRNMD